MPGVIIGGILFALGLIAAIAKKRRGGADAGADAHRRADAAHERAIEADEKAKAAESRGDTRAAAAATKEAERARSEATKARAEAERAAAAPVPHGPVPAPTAKDIEARMAHALASGDADTIEREAATLDRDGYPNEARALREEAATIREGGKPVPDAPEPAPHLREGAAPAPAPAPAPTPHRDEPAPAPAPAPGPVPEDPARALAVELTKHLQAKGELAARYHEDRELVGRYQTAAKVTPADKIYGPGTSISILERFGVIPVAPLYWSHTAAAAQKRTYLARVHELADADPERAKEYAHLIKTTERS